MRKLQRQPQKHFGSDHPVRNVRRPSWADADKVEAEIMTTDEAMELVDDEMLDAAQEAVEDVFRVDAMKIIAAALAVLFTRDE